MAQEKIGKTHHSGALVSLAVQDNHHGAIRFRSPEVPASQFQPIGRYDFGRFGVDDGPSCLGWKGFSGQPEAALTQVNGRGGPYATSGQGCADQTAADLFSRLE